MLTTEKYAHIDGDRKQLLSEHLVSVSEMAARHAATIGLGPAGRLIGVVHDLGKYSDTFQSYIRADAEKQRRQKGKIDHSTAGAQYLWKHLPDPANDFVSRFLRELTLLCVASHHGGLKDCIESGKNKLDEIVDKPDDLTFYHEVTAKADSNPHFGSYRSECPRVG